MLIWHETSRFSYIPAITNHRVRSMFVFIAFQETLVGTEAVPPAYTTTEGKARLIGSATHSAPCISISNQDNKARWRVPSRDGYSTYWAKILTIVAKQYFKV